MRVEVKWHEDMWKEIKIMHFSQYIKRMVNIQHLIGKERHLWLNILLLGQDD
nr:MAG TPA: hypothetical protein [Caudoviricetes sp.]